MFLVGQVEQPDISAVIDMIIRDAEQKKSFYKEMVRHLLLVLLLKIIAVNKYERSREIPEEEGKTNHRGIVKVLDYIDRNYAQELRIEDMARECSMSETHFREIGAEVGFPVQAAFIRNFKSITGYSPAEWRATK